MKVCMPLISHNSAIVDGAARGGGTLGTRGRVGARREGKGGRVNGQGRKGG